MKKKDKEIKPVGKAKILFAWIILLIAISSALGLSYLKFFGPNLNIEEKPIDNNDTTSPIIIEALNSIVNNFNESSYVQDYKNQNIDINASLNGTTIKVNYTSDVVASYDFKFNSPNLVASINNSSLETFKIIYKIMVYANQKRLGNDNNIDLYIDNFLNNDTEVLGLTKEENNDTINFSIDVSKTIGEVSTNQENNISQNNSDNSVITNDKQAEEDSTKTDQDANNIQLPNSNNIEGVE